MVGDRRDSQTLLPKQLRTKGRDMEHLIDWPGVPLLRSLDERLAGVLRICPRVKIVRIRAG